MSTRPSGSGGIITDPVSGVIGIVFGFLAGAAGWWVEGFLASALAALSVAGLGAALMRWWERRRSSRLRPDDPEGS
ncbi:hypothetical protein [Kocuria rosea]|uniref:hypothetical protein n=1 Tax=Kocuria rosea TaxID=1275 RepID=UPI000D65A34C|nr:hypothetical protein [Kocuria rosea]PWF79578.1 hypothetical protein DEJ38_17210 [Kocuria rosea]